MGVHYTRIDAGGSHDLNGKNQKYLQMNPNGLVPTIDDDGYILWESNAIMRYLAAKHSSPLYPVDLKIRGRIEQWLDWYITAVIDTRIAFIQLYRTPVEKQDKELIKDSVEKGNGRFLMLEEHFKSTGQKYMCGDEFTIGDIPMATQAHRWLTMKTEGRIVTPDLPHVTQWYNRITERKPFKDVCMIPLT